MEHKEQFRRDLASWYDGFRRDLPWRRTQDPYEIWISEIMLQQTRVAAVIPYYERFLARFPSVVSLAEAAEEDVLTQWAGLGYYYRARNLQRAAQMIAKAGKFPATFAGILALPGIGDYTAAAIASIAFNLPHAVVDGNVYRVLSRLYVNETNIASSRGKKEFKELAGQLLDRDHPGSFNQAMMELGATVCSPKGPQCLVCPVAAHCRARALNRAEDLPVKIADQRSIRIERILYWIERAGEVLTWQRPAASRLMAGFRELPEAEHLPGLAQGPLLGEFRHCITIYDYRFQVVAAEPPANLGHCEWKSLRELETAAVSTIFHKAWRIVENRRTQPYVRKAASGGPAR